MCGNDVQFASHKGFGSFNMVGKSGCFLIGMLEYDPKSVTICSLPYTSKELDYKHRGWFREQK